MKYVLLFRGGTPAAADRDAHMKEWGGWIGGLAAKGVFESGLPFSGQAKTVSGKATAVSDFTPGQSGIGGFLLINADSLAAATEIAKGAPHHKEGGSTDIYEAMEMPVPA